MSLQKIKLVLCITHAERGGAQKYVYNIAELLKDTYDITIVSSFAGDMRAEFESLSGVRRIMIPDLTRQIHIVKDLKAFLSLLRFFKSYPCDIAHFNSPKASALGRIAVWCAGKKIPVVYTLHLLEFSAKCAGLREKFFKLAERLLNSITDCIVVHSGYEKSVLLAQGFPPAKIRIIRPGIHTEPFKDISQRRQLRVSSGSYRVLHVTSFKPHKDPYLFARCAVALLQKNETVTIDVLGDGPLRQAIEAYIRRFHMEGRVNFHGFREDIAPYLESASCLLVTSQQESVSYAVIESLLARVPVVSAYKGVFTEILREGDTGYFVDRDPRQMSEQVINILKKVERVYTIGKMQVMSSIPFDTFGGDQTSSFRARKKSPLSINPEQTPGFSPGRVERVDWGRERMAGELDRVYSSLLNRKS